MKNSRTNISEYWEQVCYNDDIKAFEALFYMLHIRLIRFAMLYIRQKEASEEIVSEVFVKCWEARKNLGAINNPETYIFVSVKNQCLNYIKKFSHIHLVQIEESDEVEFINTFDPAKELEQKELYFLLDKAVEALPRQACIIFKLIKEDGLKYKEVAEILNISPRTVQTQLFRAIKKLSIILSSHHIVSRPQPKRFLGPVLPGALTGVFFLNLFFQFL